jgi:glycerate kinase
MTGAAGGLSGGLWATFGAHLVLGAVFVLGVLGFDDRLERVDAVITGEGQLDAQSLEGKLVGQLARRCREAGLPLHVITGSNRLDAAEATRRGIASVSEAGTPEAIGDAAGRIADPAG